VNLIGEHVDYLGGVVLPAAVDRHTRVSGRQAREWSIESNVGGGLDYLRAIGVELGAPARVAVLVQQDVRREDGAAVHEARPEFLALAGAALVDERGNVVGVVSAKLNAAAALASRDDDEAKGTLENALNDPEPLVREAAANSLAAIRVRAQAQ